MTARLICLLCLFLAAGARAEERRPGAEEVPAGAPTPRLSLDRLLRVPPPDPTGEIVRGGKDREQWQEAFSAVRAELAELEEGIRSTQERLRASAGEDWQFSATGGGPAQDPEVVKLRSDLRRDRQSLEAARQRLRELDVEASLAEVPESWRHAAEGESSPEEPEPDAR